MTDPTEAREAEIRARHVPDVPTLPANCVDCSGIDVEGLHGEPWPCDAALLLATLDEVRAEAARLRNLVECFEDDLDHWRDRALLAEGKIEAARKRLTEALNDTDVPGLFSNSFDGGLMFALAALSAPTPEPPHHHHTLTCGDQGPWLCGKNGHLASQCPESAPEHPEANDGE